VGVATGIENESQTSVVEGGTRNAVVEPKLVLGMPCARLRVRQRLRTGTVHQVVVCKVVGGAVKRAPHSRRRLCKTVHAYEYSREHI